MLTRLDLKNFQSVYDAEIRFGKLTVIVGPSSSGKSAMLRALRILAGNTSSPTAYVSHGKKALYVRGWFEAQGELLDTAISVERGKSLSTYTVNTDEGESKYAKAGTSVPEPVAAFLRFPEIEGFSLNFTSQFDKPFLLDAPATQVAKVLGDLTRINVIYDAVREANRRRLSDQTLWRTRVEDLEKVRTKVSEYADIPQQKARLDSARTLWERVVGLQIKVQELQHLVSSMNVIEAHVAHVEQQPLPPPIDWEPLNQAQSQLTNLGLLVKGFEQQMVVVRGSSADITLMDEEIRTLHVQHHELLVEAGVCPVCGQSTEVLRVGV